MTEYYGGDIDYSLGFKIIIGFVVVVLLVFAAEGLWYTITSKKFFEKFTEPLSNVGTTYDAAGFGARKNVVLSNVGEGMHNREHLVETNDRPTGWVPGMANGLPNGWDVAPAPAAGAPTVSKMTPGGKLNGDDTLTRALNST
jgi:hypothetical protein